MSAYRFGWMHLRQAFAEHAWLYAAFIILDAALATYGAWDGQWRSGNIAAGLAVFPALAYCARLIVPDRRMSAKDVLALVLIGFIVIAGTAVLFALVFALSMFLRALAFVVAFPAIAVAIWALVKFSFSAIAYMTAENGRVLRSLGESWEMISGEMWGAVFATGFLVLLTIFVPMVAVAVAGAGIATAHLSPGLLFAVSLVSASINTVATVWGYIANTALFSWGAPSVPVNDGGLS